MTDHNDDMDQNWKFRLERQRIQDAWEKSQWDRTERRVMTLIWTVAFLFLLIIGAGVIVALRQSKAVSVSQPGSLTIVVPSASPSPSPTPEPEAESTFGTPQGASIIASTEPPKLRTVQNHPPSARPVQPGPQLAHTPKKEVGFDPLKRGSANVSAGVTGWRDSRYSQAFEGGAARWLPTVIAVAGDHTGRSRDTGVGAHRSLGLDKADGLSPYHLRTLATSPETCRAAKSESAGLSRTRTAVASNGPREQFEILPAPVVITRVLPSVRVGAGTSFQSLATSAAGLCGIPDDKVALFHALIDRESTWRQWDAHGMVLQSSSGALGLGQVKPATAREISPTLDVRQPWGNLLASACYLRKMVDRFGGDWSRGLLAYRLGPAGLSTREARAYVQDILEGSAQ